MSNGYIGNARMSYKEKKYLNGANRFFSQKSAALIVKEARERKKAEEGAIYESGPRGILYHYVFQLNLSENAAIKMFLQKYSSYNETICKGWLNDKKAIEKWQIEENRKYQEKKERDNEGR